MTAEALQKSYIDNPEIDRIARKALFEGELTRAEIHDLAVAVLAQLAIDEDRAKASRESRPR